jgi:N-acetylmuramoyl-L-alanine amidase
VPAVLLEMGFITNPQDERRLRDERERTEMADAVAESIDEYFSRTIKFASR